MKLNKIVAFCAVQGSCFGFSALTYFRTVFPDNPTVQKWGIGFDVARALQTTYEQNKAKRSLLLSIPGIREHQQKIVYTDIRNIRFQDPFPNHFLFYFSCNGYAHAMYVNQDQNKIWDSRIGTDTCISFKSLDTTLKEIVTVFHAEYGIQKSDQIMYQVITYNPTVRPKGKKRELSQISPEVSEGKNRKPNEIDKENILNLFT